MKHAAHASGRRRRQPAGQGGRLRSNRVSPGYGGEAARSGPSGASQPVEGEASRPIEGEGNWPVEGEPSRPLEDEPGRPLEDEAGPLEDDHHWTRPAGARPAHHEASGGRKGGGGVRRYAQLPYWVVLGVVALGLLLLRGGDGQALRGGTFVIAGALLAGSVIRLALPEGRAGMLGSRRRLADTAVLTVLGIGLLIAGLTMSVPG